MRVWGRDLSPWVGGLGWRSRQQRLQMFTLICAVQAGMERGCVSSEWSDATEVRLSGGNKYTSKWGGTGGKRPDHLLRITHKTGLAR